MVDGSSSTARVAADLRNRAAATQPGTRLPSSRALMAQFGVGPGTVARAVGRLIAEGVLVTEPGRGTFVAHRLSSASRQAHSDTDWQTVALGEAPVDGRDVAALNQPAAPGVLVLSTGYPSADLQPLAALTAAAVRAARRPGGWALAPAAGLPELRSLLAAAVGADPGDVLVIPGGQAGLSTAMRALAPPGAPVLVEVPTYLGALAAARAAGLHPLPVPTDAGGLRADLLPAAFATTGARLLYVQPTYANPNGTVLEPERRQQILAAARDAGAFVLEDDWARYLALDAPAPPPLLHDDVDGHVVHLSSMSKAAAPSLRIGALVARGPAAARLATVRLVDDFGVARPLQETALQLLGAPAWPRHLNQLTTALRRRRDHLSAELYRHLPQLLPPVLPRGGLHLWSRLPPDVDDAELTARARAHNLLIGAGRPYFVTEPPAPHLRLTYAGANEEQLTAGVRRLRELIP
ncbi:PLP-dependent aminotransferase family protein [Blastococcus sp. TF02-09]|uniref:aminotransferase-like domain-containing protein n=1 Tax=Blastococcus sp. TF02-09 TaxID=2250576 RepID=UPI000DE99080|nr:PLP-dependent aminotransferase family protein [Blastococcus sp. TF02-9]RBY81098.1 PLP-dependent aminotransferase family protein [Blastococcus sp. TF02-9]